MWGRCWPSWAAATGSRPWSSPTTPESSPRRRPNPGLTAPKLAAEPAYRAPIASCGAVILRGWAVCRLVPADRPPHVRVLCGSLLGVGECLHVGELGFGGAFGDFAVEPQAGVDVEEVDEVRCGLDVDLFSLGGRTAALDAHNQRLEGLYALWVAVDV